MITLVEVDQIWQDEQTIYYFDVDGSTYALADNNGELSLLDYEGYPIEPCNDHNRVRAQLEPIYREYIK